MGPASERSLLAATVGVFAFLLSGCDECVGLSGDDLGKCCEDNPASGSCDEESCDSDGSCVQEDAGAGSGRCTVGSTGPDDCSLRDDIEFQVVLQAGEVAAERYQIPLSSSDGAVEVTLRYLASPGTPTLRATVTDEMGGLVGVLDVNPGSERTATFGVRAEHAYALLVETSPSSGEASYSIAAHSVTSSVEFEPNDTPLSAHLIRPGMAVSGGMSNRTSSDLDYFSLVAPADARRLTVNLVRPEASSGALMLSILNADEAALGQRQVGTDKEQVVVGVSPGETYYARVALEGLGVVGEYTLTPVFSSSYFEVEPNETAPTATPLVPGIEMFGGFAEKGAFDQDVFTVAPPASMGTGATMIFSIESFLAVTAAPISVSVTDRQGVVLQSTSVAAMSSQTIAIPLAGDDTLFIALSGPRDLTGQAYRLSAILGSP